MNTFFFKLDTWLYLTKLKQNNLSLKHDSILEQLTKGKL